MRTSIGTARPVRGFIMLVSVIDVAVHTNARVYRHRPAGPRFHNHHYHPRQHRAADTDVSYCVCCIRVSYVFVIVHRCYFFSYHKLQDKLNFAMVATTGTYKQQKDRT